MKRKAGNNQYLKERNQRIVLDLIRTEKSLSKAELSELTGLSANAVGMITSALMEEGYIYESGIGRSNGGRKPILLSLKPHSYYSIGFDIDVDSIQMVAVDITGDIIDSNRLDMPDDCSIEKASELIDHEILRILHKNEIMENKLLGVGLSVPGLINAKDSRIILAPNLGWKDVQIKGILTKAPAKNIYIENEAMASAICEHWLGSCKNLNNFVCINIKTGIGSGIFANGQPYRGANGTAGEVGHIVVCENGPKCGCGNYGCLETVASTKSIIEETKRRVRQGVVSVLNSIDNVDDINIDAVARAAKEGDHTAYGILLESTRYLGIALASLTNILNPEKIILGKDFVIFGEMVMEYLKEITKKKSLEIGAANVDIGASGVGEIASCLGAAIIPLKILFGK